MFSPPPREGGFFLFIFCLTNYSKALKLNNIKVVSSGKKKNLRVRHERIFDRF